MLTPQLDGAWQFTCSSADAGAGPDATWTLHATGTIVSAPSTPLSAAISLDEARSRCPRRRDVAEHFRVLAAAGLDYGPAFRGIAELWSGDRAALARVLVAPPDLGANSAEYATHPALLDACLQTFVASLDGHAELYVPVGWESFVYRSPPAAREGNHHAERDADGGPGGNILPLSPGEGWGEGIWAFAQLDDPRVVRNSFLDEPSLPDGILGRLTIFDAAGAPFACWSGIRLKRLPRPTSESSAGTLATKESDVEVPGTSLSTADFERGGDGLLNVVYECAVRVLELPPSETIALDDNLYDLGMDSIMATELLFHIEKSLGCSLPMKVMAKSRTITQIVEMVRSKRKEPAE